MASANYGRIKEIQDLADFFQSLDDAGTKLVVVDFFAKGFASFLINRLLFISRLLLLLFT